MGNWKRRFFFIRRTFSVRPHYFIPNPSPLPHAVFPHILCPQSDSNYQFVVRTLESCKLPSSYRTAISVHSRIIKQGYGMCPVILSMLVKVYISCERPSVARQLVPEIMLSNCSTFSANLMIDSFMKIREVGVAMTVFSALPYRDVVTWNSIIGGCVKNSLYVEAITMFSDMLAAKIEPDGYTFASVIHACSRLGALDQGKRVHNLMLEKGILLNYILSSALVDMYSRCGRIQMAKSVFDASQRTHVSIWNAMINGFAMHGLTFDAISLFSQMEESISPDSVSFIGLLTACSHCGAVVHGRKYFDLMKRKYLIEPELEHYGAMVDMFARAGFLDEAYAIIKDMPIEPDIVIWRALLNGCRFYRDHKLGEEVVTKIKNLGSGDYVLLSNIYSSTRKWGDAQTVRQAMQNKGVRKSTAKSWIEIHGSIHRFKASDRSHPEREAIYNVLEALIHRTVMEGYTYSPDLVLMDILEEEKEENLSYHSEKLALAFGVLKSTPGSDILISKNLRTCLDCHLWMKIVSKVLHRVIILRDRIRFHRFEKGVCSCGDYW